MARARRIILLLGSNLQKPLLQLRKARLLIEKRIGKIRKSSSFYKTAPWGLTNQPAFINQAIQLVTGIEPIALLTKLKSIEKDMGRKELILWGPRIIDIDILFMGHVIMNSEALTVPHPRMADRRFVLVPLAELIPTWIHPVYHMSIKELLGRCPDLSVVDKIATHG
jgi:2-amino-4-hydroxy-6-hydroxymethyldihydropteridine diphosphokinase